MHPEQRFCPKSTFWATEVITEVNLIFFPTKISKIVRKIQLKFSRMSEKCAKVCKIVGKIRQIRLYLSRVKGRCDPIEVEIAEILTR